MSAGSGRVHSCIVWGKPYTPHLPDWNLPNRLEGGRHIDKEAHHQHPIESEALFLSYYQSRVSQLVKQGRGVEF